MVDRYRSSGWHKGESSNHRRVDATTLMQLDELLPKQHVTQFEQYEHHPELAHSDAILIVPLQKEDTYYMESNRQHDMEMQSTELNWKGLEAIVVQRRHSWLYPTQIMAFLALLKSAQSGLKLMDLSYQKKTMRLSILCLLPPLLGRQTSHLQTLEMIWLMLP